MLPLSYIPPERKKFFSDVASITISVPVVSAMCKGCVESNEQL